MSVMTKVSSRYGLLLGFCALICTIISAGVYSLTKNQIEEAMLAQQKDLLLQVVPQNYFDNDFVQSDLVPQTEQLQGIQKIYFARKAGQLTAYAYETTAPDGYSGNIRMLVGLTPAGKVLGVRVIEHHETPGLGDKIELRISNWILSFSNKWLKADNLNDWAVKKDGGKFDQFSGATITPRAVVNQVRRSAQIMLDNSTLLQQMAAQEK